MPSMKQEIEQVLARLNSLMADDGSRLTLVEVKGDAVTIRFEEGEAGQCESCVIDGDTLEMLVREAVANHLPAVGNVTLIRKS
jgi:Fe-S cluster biogenesis protein NfuA